ncbi:hypothetical protein ACSBR1_035093 [Camellia fascicularis]
MTDSVSLCSSRFSHLLVASLYLWTISMRNHIGDPYRRWLARSEVKGFEGEATEQQKLRNDTWMEQTKLVFFYQGKLLAKSATKIKHRDPTVPVVSWSNICKYDMFPFIALTTVAERGKQQVTSSMQRGNISN